MERVNCIRASNFRSSARPSPHSLSFRQRVYGLCLDEKSLIFLKRFHITLFQARTWPQYLCTTLGEPNGRGMATHIATDVVSKLVLSKPVKDNTAPFLSSVHRRQSPVCGWRNTLYRVHSYGETTNTHGRRCHVEAARRLCRFAG